MPAPTAQRDLWSLVRGAPWIDPEALLSAVEHECAATPHDFRTRLLLRDAGNALAKRWGRDQLYVRLSDEARSVLNRIDDENLGEPGFPTIEKRMADALLPETILEFLRELGAATDEPARLEVGGSGALILAGLLARHTDDVDTVDEVPLPLRSNHALLDRLSQRYGIRLTHFQSHYLPTGWQNRLRSIGRFRVLDVYLIDPLDIFVGKLFSAREKDRDDLRALKLHLEKAKVVERVRSSARQLMSDAKLRSDAEKNWYILFGEPMPV